MTQPAVTFQVRQLEDDFNARLFDRTHNRIALTEAGQVVYDYAERIFELYTEMENVIQALVGDVSGALTVGASTTIAEYMLPTLLRGFKDVCPKLNLKLRVSNSDGIVSMVENSLIDIGIVEAPVTNRNLVVEVCRVDQLVVVVPPGHPLTQRTALRMDEVMHYPFICREEGSGTREVIMSYITGLGLDRNGLNVCLELGSPESIKGAVEAGMGISILSRTTLAKELALSILACVPLDPPLERAFSFVYKRQKFRIQAIKELLDFARHYCEQQNPKAGSG